MLTGIENDPRSIVHTRIARENWAEMQRFWREDADGREFIVIISELHKDMARPEQPFDGLCPETRRNVEPLQERACSKSSENKRTCWTNS